MKPSPQNPATTPYLPPQGAFLTTHWTELLAARTSNPENRRLALNDLFTRYWRPVYMYLRKKGMDSERAKDVTQSFFQDIFLEKQLADKADQAKGRFRSFLLTALNRYVINMHKAEQAAKRCPQAGIIPLDQVDFESAAAPHASHSPEDAFHYAWACDLLKGVYAEVEATCRESGKVVHWEIFYRKVLSPIFEETQAPAVSELCREMGVEKESQAYNMIETVKRIFRARLTSRLRMLVDSEDQVDQEFQELMDVFSRG